MIAQGKIFLLIYYRYYHTAVYLDYLKTMYVFGGFVKRGNNVEATNEMWKFAIGAHKWTLEVRRKLFFFS